MWGRKKERVISSVNLCEDDTPNKPEFTSSGVLVFGLASLTVLIWFYDFVYTSDLFPSTYTFSSTSSMLRMILPHSLLPFTLFPGR